MMSLRLYLTDGDLEVEFPPEKYTSMSPYGPDLICFFDSLTLYLSLILSLSPLSTFCQLWG